MGDCVSCMLRSFGVLDTGVDAQNYAKTHYLLSIRFRIIFFIYDFWVSYLS